MRGPPIGNSNERATSPRLLEGWLRNWLDASRWETVSSTVLTLVGSFVLTGLVLALTGQEVVGTFRIIFANALGDTTSLADTLLQTTPLILTGLAVAICFRIGFFNVGVEGALYLGAFAAAWVGFTFVQWPGFLLITTGFGLAGLVGAVWLGVPAALNVYLDVDEVVSTLMLNYVAINITSYLVNYPFLPKGVANSMSAPVATQARLPRLLPPSQLNLSFLLALACGIGLALVIRRTSPGMILRVVGYNERFARVMGMPVDRVLIGVTMLSGLLGAWVGAGQVLGVNYRFIDGFSPGWGYDGITIALLARNNPWAVLPAAFLFGILRSGGGMLQITSSVPLSIVNILQAAILLLVTVQIGVPRFWRRS